jgi:hypothetical protein
MAGVHGLHFSRLNGAESEVRTAQVLSIGAIVALHASQMGRRGVAAKNFTDGEKGSSFANHS